MPLTIDVLAEDRPDDFVDAYSDATVRGPRWRQRLAATLAPDAGNATTSRIGRRDDRRRGGRDKAMTLACATLANLDWRALGLPIARAEDALARLDERLAKKPDPRRPDREDAFSDLAAALWIEGEFVHLKDLMLHDASMDVRAPTHELTRAHAILRTRRRIAGVATNWAMSPAGLDGFRGRSGEEQSPPG